MMYKYIRITISIYICITLSLWSTSACLRHELMPIQRLQLRGHRPVQLGQAAGWHPGRHEAHDAAERLERVAQVLGRLLHEGQHGQQALQDLGQLVLELLRGSRGGRRSENGPNGPESAKIGPKRVD